MNKMMRLLFYPCRKATELVEKRHLTRLRPTESLRLRAHVTMCRSCARYAHESEVFDKALSGLTQQPPDAPALSAAEKNQLIDTLKQSG
jgi:hypothetical protein